MIVFDEKFVCGISVIDEQHKILAGLINDLEKEVESDDPDFKSRLKEILDFAKYHFVTEEAFWIRIGAKNISEHEKLHVEFLDFIEAIVDKNDMDRAGYAVEIKKLEEFVENHFVNVDKAMFDKANLYDSE